MLRVATGSGWSPQMIPRRRYNLERDFLAEAVKGTLAPSRERAWTGRFESLLASALRHDRPLTVQATASGRAALAVLLDVLGVPRGSTIMIPAYTLGALGPFLTDIGYRWITCDVDDARPVMTPETVLAAWPDDHTVKCVLATHLFGVPADVPAISRAVAGLGAIVIEDCAHSIGSTLNGLSTGTLGKGAIFSFNYLKPVNCFGGGALVLPGQRELLPLPVQPGFETAGMFARGLAEDMVFAGPWLRIPTAMLAFGRLNGLMLAVDRVVRRPADEEFRIQAMSPWQALHGIHSLKTLEHRLAVRRSIARTICAAAEIDDSLFREDSTSRSNAYFLTVKVRDAAAFRRELWMHGIDAGIGTEVADYVDCPVCDERPAARAWFAQAVQVPCHESLTGRQVRAISEMVGRHCGESRII